MKLLLFSTLNLKQTGEFSTLGDKYPHLSDTFSKYLCIGFNGNGDPLCIDETQEAIVVELDHESNFQRRFMNTSIPQLAESLLLFSTLIVKTIEQNGNDTYLNNNIPEEVQHWFYDEIACIDLPALYEGSFWASKYLKLTEGPWS